MAQEIERKYLLDNEDWKNLPVTSSYKMKQGYIDKKETRIAVDVDHDKEVLSFSFSPLADPNTKPMTLTFKYNEQAGFANIMSVLKIDPDTGGLTLAKGADFRLRIREDLETGEKQAFATVKMSTDNPDISHEFEDAVDITPAKKILDHYGRHVVKKQRHVIDMEGDAWEVDVFKGHLKGLVMAEIEVPSVEEFEHVTKLPGLGRDVTADPRYKNKALGRYGIPKQTLRF